jgi:hypothetical protein
MVAAWDGVTLFWVVLFVHVLPMAFLVWATWFIWRTGRRTKRHAEAPGERTRPAPTTWEPAFCRDCGYGTPVHSRTGLCATCHTRPLPEKAAVPSHLPDSL